MAIANELTINTSATALEMAQSIFGSGVQVVSATYSGAAVSSGIYSGAQTTIAGIVPGDSGVILSTGRVVDFTNSSGTTNTNTAGGTTTDTAGIDDDAQLNAIAGRATFDGAILNANFIPDGDFLTMQFVFTSEEYPEYVGSNFNDAFGVWVNGNFVPLTITTTGEVAINTVNGVTNQNLFVDNTADQFNTEMDGFTRVLSFKAPVNAGQVNTIKIGIADAGDTGWDSNLLIAGDSIQTIALAFDDSVQLVANSSRTFDVLANDNDQMDSGLTITHINGNPVVAGQTITLATGERVRLNADGTVTVFSDGDIGTNSLSYTIADGSGNTDVGFLTITTVSSLTRDGIVEGTAGNDVIQTGYLGDPNGDLVDANDALGVGGTTGDGDYILAGAGNDSVTSGAGNDVVYAGSGNDTVFGGAGNDDVSLGIGNDLFGSTSSAEAGNDTIDGDQGNDTIFAGAGNDVAYGGTGSDSLSGGQGSDTLFGGADADTFVISDDFGYDSLSGGESGTDTDLLSFGTTLTTAGVSVTLTGAEAGTYAYAATPAGFPQATGAFTGIEQFSGTGFGDTINGALNTGAMTVSGNDGADVITGGSAADSLDGGNGADSIIGGNGVDTLLGQAGNDTLSGGAGNDQVFGGADNDSLLGGDGNDLLNGGAGSDTLAGGVGADTLSGGTGMDFADYSTSAQGVSVNLNTLTASGGDATGDAIDGTVDGIIGSGGNDTLTGSDSELIGGADAYTSIIYGGGGNDLIDGRAGSDQLFGGSGNDTIIGGTGSDTIQTGTDADSIFGGSGDVIDGGEGGTDSDTLVTTGVYSVAFDPNNSENGTITFLDASTLTFTNIERLVLNGGNPDGIIWGTAGDDSIGVGFVDANGDIVDGQDALLPGAAPNDDLIFAYGGNDTVTSGLGNDQVYGGDGADLITTGAGNDDAQGDAGNDTLFGGDGNDTLTGGDGADQLFGGANNDTLTGGAGSDTLDGGDGNDRLDGGAEADSLSGGLGNDTLFGGTGDTLYGGAGNDEITLAGNPGVVDGGADRDVIHATRSFTGVIDGGGSGDDFDTLDLTGIGAHRVVFSQTNPENGTVELLNADGAIASSFQFVNIENVFGDKDFIVEGTGGNDIIGIGYAGDPEGDLVDSTDNFEDNNDDLIEAYGGNDSVQAGQGNDVVFGGTGSDTLLGEAGNDTLNGEDGHDVLFGGQGNDVLDGGTGNDTIHIEAGNDTAFGGDGEDTFVVTSPMGSTNSVDGGTGFDRLDFSGHTGGVTVGYTGDEAGFVSSDGSGSITFAEIEAFTLTAADDSLDATSATSGINVDAGGGNDQIQDGAGADTILGGSGDDAIISRGGEDILDGGTGDDVLILGEGFGNAAIFGGTGGETAGDTLAIGVDAGTAVRVDLTNADATRGTVTSGGNTATFEQIEAIELGDGTHTLVLADGSGADRVISFGGPIFTPGFGWTGFDQLDVAGLTDAGGAPVNTADVVVTDDGQGNAVLTFPNGENLTLIGVAPADVSSAGALNAMGIPLPPANDIVEGTVGADLIDDTYTGDPQGDLVDASDNLAGTDDDVIEAGAGNDTVVSGAGNDFVLGEDGNDQLFGGTGADTLVGGVGNDVLDGGDAGDLLQADDGDDTIFGGIGDTVEGGDGYDVLDLTAFGHPGTEVTYTGPQSGTVQFYDINGDDAGSLTFTGIERVVACFTPGSLILTDAGEVAVEKLTVGDRVLTRDNGFQDIRWLARRDLSVKDLAANATLCPIRIAEGALGDGLPERDLIVSPQHRMLIAGSRTELLFGEREVLVAACHLLSLPGVSRIYPAGISYIHFLFDQHEIVRADGAWSESFQPGVRSIAGLDDDQRHELRVLFPDLGAGEAYPAARMALKSREARVLLAA